MEVSQIAELDTHAVIGGSNVEAFEISNSAEFFTVLSASLYRDKKLAAVREVICNAWDAHIMGGCTDKPVKITLTEDTLTIQDFGPGIADEQMRPIYCIYGGSTKVHDGKQTGGFGLGSKAPFAYTDHFTVTSSHAGIRTVYSVSRGGTETGGKPELRRMVRVPTTETGLTVSMPIDPDDEGKFGEIIERVVSQGGINATLNDEVLARLDYTEARKAGFCVIDHSIGTESDVYVLYGTVLYPVTTTDEKVTQAVSDLMELLPSFKTVILLAPPHSVGVTPSRESLSYTSRTTATVLQLIQNLAGQLRQRQHLGRLKLMAELKDRVVRGMHPKHHSIASHSHRPRVADPMADIDKIAEWSSYYQLVASPKPRLVAHAAATSFPDDRRLYRRWQTVRSADWDRKYFLRSARIHQRLARRVDLERSLYVVRGDESSILKSAVDKGRPIAGGIAKPVLFVAPSPRALKAAFVKWAAALNEAAMKRSGNYAVTYGDRAIGIVKSKLPTATLDQIKLLAAHYKLEVIEAEEVKPVAKKPQAPKPAPTVRTYFSLDNIQRRSEGFYAQYRFSDSSPTLTNPKYYLMARERGRSFFYAPMDLDYDKSDAIKTLFPETALIWLEADEEKLKKAGAVPLHEAVFAELRKLTGRRDVLYAIARAQKFFQSEAYDSNSVAYLVQRLMRFDAVCQFLFPAPKVKLAPETDLIFQLIIVAKALFSHSGDRDLRKQRDDLLKALDDQAAKEFAHYKLTGRQIDERFAALRCMAGHPIYSSEEDYLLETIKVLMRHFERKKTATPKVETP